MHIRSEATGWTQATWSQTLRMILAGFLAVALVGFVTACDSTGGNGDGNGDDGGSGISAPAAPSGLEAAPQDGAAQLSWGPVDGADTYRVYRDTSAGVDTSSSALETGIGQASYTDGSVENGTEYFYLVSAVASEGGESAESEGSGEAGAVPFAAPSGLEGTSGDSQVELSWEAAAGAQTYSVYRDTSSGVDVSSSALETGVGQTSYADTTAENGAKYYYRVTSVNPNGAESSPSNEVGKSAFSDPPDRP